MVFSSPAPLWTETSTRAGRSRWYLHSSRSLIWARLRKPMSRSLKKRPGMTILLTRNPVMRRTFLSSGPESKIVRRIIDRLRVTYPGAYLRKIHGNQFQHAGIPDLVGCIEGAFVGLEVK